MKKDDVSLKHIVVINTLIILMFLLMYFGGASIEILMFPLFVFVVSFAEFGLFMFAPFLMNFILLFTEIISEIYNKREYVDKSYILQLIVIVVQVVIIMLILANLYIATRDFAWG